MGYRRKLQHNTWVEGHEYHGLEVTMRRISVGRLLDVQAIGLDVPEGATWDVRRRAALAADEAMIRAFAEHLVKWNLEDDDGNPVGTSYDDIVAHVDPDMLWDVVGSWRGTITGDDAEDSADPTSADSPDGGPAPLPIPQEPLDDARAS